MKWSALAISASPASSKPCPISAATSHMSASICSEKAKESVTGMQLKNRWKYIKKLYRLYASLVNKSGWTWDYAQHRQTPDNIEVWDDVIKFNKEYKTARDRSFPLYWLVHELTGASIATRRFAVGSTEERIVVDVEGSGSFATASPVEQDFDGNGDVHMGGRDEANVYRSETKRKKPVSDNPRAGKKSGDATATALEKLVELSAGRSKIVEQYDSEENYSYKLCMDKLTAMPGITAEEIFVGGQAFKQWDERMFFLSIPPMAVF
ncbi:hypothetical protein J5N97_001403 [Dioscorea zingiberensis]|uniref:Myb/SANT-like domain-containing protein n=1 Tax=Dioscorea zingiberensis TaxID=325984 RepID=A0A9D5H2D8_9LILI|nr:hypothetical protein J5N97_001403 [Dioscorea zingiberensis]